jgi:hypothetical protein
VLVDSLISGAGLLLGLAQLLLQLASGPAQPSWKGWRFMRWGKRQLGRQQDVAVADGHPPLVGRVGPGRLEDHDIGPVAVHLEVARQRGDGVQVAVGVDHQRQQIARLLDAAAQLALPGLPVVAEAVGVLLVGDAALDDLDTQLGIVDAGHVHGQAEAVQQLRPQVALLRVHGAHQDELGRVAEADALALHHVDPHGGRVQQQIHHVIVQQVDLIDIKQAAVGRGQHARLEVALAPLDRLLDVQRADDAVLGGADRQIDEAGAAGGHGSTSPASTRARHSSQ